MKVYMVEITTYAVVMAESEIDARVIAYDHQEKILAEDDDPQIDPMEVKSLAELGHGWDGECIPYGDDGNTPLKGLLLSDARQP